MLPNPFKRNNHHGTESNVLQPEALIELRGVVKEFATAAGKFTALKGIDLRVEKGEFIAVIGKSGSGKSTLLNMIAGIDRPTTGEVWMNHTAVHRLSEGQMAVWRGKNLGIVFQFFQLLPTLTNVENVMLPMDFCNVYPSGERYRRAMHLLDLVEMTEHAHKLPSAISGGQQQRVAIARALANDPPILMADEPTGNLDSKTADSVFSLFEALAKQGKTILMVTHDGDLAKRVRRTLILSDGEIIDEYLAKTFPALNEVQLRAAMHQLQPAQYAPGQLILRQGQAPDRFYIITQGKVDVLIGPDVLVTTMSAGQYFGEVELIHGGANIATIRAAQDTGVHVAALDRATFDRVIAESTTAEQAIRQVAEARIAENSAARNNGGEYA
jgi:ABC-type lipoprotein export system ATPase subunit